MGLTSAPGVAALEQLLEPLHLDLRQVEALQGRFGKGDSNLKINQTTGGNRTFLWPALLVHYEKEKNLLIPASTPGVSYLVHQSRTLPASSGIRPSLLGRLVLWF